MQSLSFSSSSFLNPNSIAAAATAFLPCPSSAFIEKTNNLLDTGNSSITTPINLSPNMAAAAMAAISTAAVNWQFAQINGVTNTIESLNTDISNITTIKKNESNIPIYNSDTIHKNEFLTANPLFNLFPINSQFNQRIESTSSHNIKSIDLPDDAISQNLMSSNKTMPPSFFINNISNTQLF